MMSLDETYKSFKLNSDILNKFYFIWDKCFIIRNYT
jgi:hypothetical protein